MTAASAAGRRALQVRAASSLARHLDRHAERLTWDPGRLASFQRDRLRALLGHAAGHSPFHARRLRGLDPSRFELADLPRLPTMTKGQMMAAFDEVVTDPRLARRRAEEHLAASTTEPALLLGRYVCLASGGSSGLRGVFVQTLDEYTEFVASIVRQARTRMTAAGGPPPEEMVIGIIGAASPVHSSGFGAAMAAGPPVRLIAVPVTLPLPEIVRRLNAAQPPALLGYPSKLAELAREQRAGRLRIAPRSVTAMSDCLPRATAPRSGMLSGRRWSTSSFPPRASPARPSRPGRCSASPATCAWPSWSTPATSRYPRAQRRPRSWSPTCTTSPSR